jgi:hypothetical protein
MSDAYLSGSFNRRHERSVKAAREDGISAINWSHPRFKGLNQELISSIFEDAARESSARFEDVKDKASIQPAATAAGETDVKYLLQIARLFMPPMEQTEMQAILQNAGLLDLVPVAERIAGVSIDALSLTHSHETEEERAKNEVYLRDRMKQTVPPNDWFQRDIPSTPIRRSIEKNDAARERKLLLLEFATRLANTTWKAQQPHRARIEGSGKINPRVQSDFNPIDLAMRRAYVEEYQRANSDILSTNPNMDVDARFSLVRERAQINLMRSLVKDLRMYQNQFTGSVEVTVEGAPHTGDEALAEQARRVLRAGNSGEAGERNATRRLRMAAYGAAEDSAKQAEAYAVAYEERLSEELATLRQKLEDAQQKLALAKWNMIEGGNSFAQIVEQAQNEFDSVSLQYKRVQEAHEDARLVSSYEAEHPLPDTTPEYGDAVVGKEPPHGTEEWELWSNRLTWLTSGWHTRKNRFTVLAELAKLQEEDEDTEEHHIAVTLRENTLADCNRKIAEMIRRIKPQEDEKLDKYHYDAEALELSDIFSNGSWKNGLSSSSGEGTKRRLGIKDMLERIEEAHARVQIGRGEERPANPEHDPLVKRVLEAYALALKKRETELPERTKNVMQKLARFRRRIVLFLLVLGSATAIPNYSPRVNTSVSGPQFPVENVQEPRSEPLSGANQSLTQQDVGTEEVDNSTVVTEELLGAPSMYDFEPNRDFIRPLEPHLYIDRDGRVIAFGDTSRFTDGDWRSYWLMNLPRYETQVAGGEVYVYGDDRHLYRYRDGQLERVSDDVYLPETLSYTFERPLEETP